MTKTSEEDRPPGGVASPARRRVSAGVAGAAAAAASGSGALLLTRAATAQTQTPAAPRGRFVEGVNYVRLEQAAATAVPGKIEVIEFFWYECPHCNAFEPALEAWAKQVPADVALRRVPVYFDEVPFAAQQRFFYALEASGLAATLHRKAFQTIHGERRRLRTPEDFSAFILLNGGDPVQFMTTYNSFGVQTKAQQARQTAAAYKIDAVPAMGVHGRYYTTGTLANAGSPPAAPATANARMLDVVDALLPLARRRA